MALTIQIVANQQRRSYAPGRPKQSCPRFTPTIAYPGVAPGKPQTSRHPDVAEGIARCSAGAAAKAIVATPEAGCSVLDELNSRRVSTAPHRPGASRALQSLIRCSGRSDPSLGIKAATWGGVST
jgi:hypothetical protein